VVNRTGRELAKAVYITDPVSGRSMEVFTTQPGVQCYSGNNLEELIGKGGAVYQWRGSACFETQHFPDSPNNPGFPTTVITPELPLHERAVFVFTAQ